MIKALVFDNFGVLYDRSAVFAFDALAQGDRSLETQYWDIFRASDTGLLSKGEWDQQIAELFGVSVKTWQETLSSFDNKNLKLLKKLPEYRKTYSVALLTNMGAGRVGDYYTPQEIDECFDVVVGSGDIGIAKPSRAIYEYTAKQLGFTTAEAVFIDDSQTNVDGAKEAGMQTIRFENNDQLFKELELLLGD